MTHGCRRTCACSRDGTWSGTKPEHVHVVRVARTKPEIMAVLEPCGVLLGAVHFRFFWWELD